MNNYRSIIYLVPFLFSWTAGAQVEVYPLPASGYFSPSSVYQVEVKQGGSEYQETNTFLYVVPSSDFVTKTESMSMFAFDPGAGFITMKVSMVNGTSLDESVVEVVNKTIPNLTTSFENGSLIIECGKPNEQILIRQKGDYSHQLSIFMNDLMEPEIPQGAEVVTFPFQGSPHIQSAEYDRFTVPNNVDVVYIEAGAVVQGTIHTSNGRTKPLKLMGRGIIIGNGDVIHGGSGIPWNAIELNNGSGHLIEGITCISPRHFTIRIGDNSHINNVKMFGYDTNIDGVVAGKNSVIENCHFKVNDDHVKLYNDNMTVKDCNFYMQRNGAIFQLAWNSITPGSNCIVENNEILAWEAGTGDPALGQGGIARTVLSLRETDAGPTVNDLLIKDLYISGELSRFIGINAKYGSSAPASLKGVVFENIVLEKFPKQESWIYTDNEPWEIDITFKNVTMGDECLTASNYAFKTEGNVSLTYEDCSAPDTEAPSAPENLKVNEVKKDGLGLHWDPSTDNSSIEGYEVYLDDTFWNFVQETSFTMERLECETAYSIKIRAVDNAGNFSEYSTATEAVTGSCIVLSADLTNDRRSVYPNPVTDILHLPEGKWSLYSMTGMLITSVYSSRINMSAMKSGIYCLRSENEVFRIVKF